MNSNTSAVSSIAIATLFGLVAVAQAQSLAVEPGLWKKALKMQTGGHTVMDSTIDVCMTADDLDLKKTAEKLTQSPSCKVTEQELTPKRLRVVLSCKEMVVESITEVKSSESVVLAATIKPTGGGEATLSSEQWTFVKADCAK